MIRRFVLLAWLVLAFAPVVHGAPPKPPKQPATGPGGKAAVHASVIASQHGSGATAYWLYEPSSPEPVGAPVVIFLHGWGGIDPSAYLGWIDHIAKRGNYVIYPVYQDSLHSPPADFLGNAVASVRAGLDELRSRVGGAVDTSRIAILGHSAGGNVAASLAATASTSSIPTPAALMCVEPGNSWVRARRAAIPIADLAGIAPGTLLIVMCGDRDRVVQSKDGRKIFAESINVGTGDKNFVLMQTDTHGEPGLTADHFAPLAGTGRNGRANALDFYGMWKVFDGLCDAAFRGTNREFALGNTAQQTSMGAWSDGVPVKPLVVTDAP